MRKYLNEDMNSEEKFKPTTEWMEKWYDIMNARLFNNMLQECILEPSNKLGGRTLGCFSITGQNIIIKLHNRRMYKHDVWYGDEPINDENFVILCRPTIRLNSHYSATQSAWINTLVHEMCHYYNYMNGIVPKQSHGPEFRSIASIVASRSDGKITIQRLASAEEMQNYELDDEIKQRNNARLERKRNNVKVVIVVLRKGEIRLVNTTSEKLIDEIVNLHPNQEVYYIGTCQNHNLNEFLSKLGYNNVMRTYRYWSVEGKPWLKEVLKYKWTKENGQCNNLAQALGMEEEVNDNSENKEDMETNNDYKLGYKIIQDGSGYNLLDQHNNKTFGKPVDKIWFDDNENCYYFKNSRFTYKGMPRNWKQINVSESRVDESTKYLKRIIHETIEEILTERRSEDDFVAITSDMNLGLESPLEL